MGAYALGLDADRDSAECIRAMRTADVLRGARSLIEQADTLAIVRP